MKRTIVISLSIGVALIVVLAFGFWRLFIGSSAEVEAVADQFQPQAAWNLEEEVINADYEVCLTGSPCPSVSRRYAIPERLALPEFAALVGQTGWDLAIEDNCELRKNNLGRHPVCEARGRVDDFDVHIVQWASPDPADVTTIGLHVLGER